MGMDFNNLRNTEFSRLDKLHEIYLDYTGSGLYSQWQIDQHYKLLAESVLGNPHSHSPSSIASTEHVERTRDMILKFFNASPDEYQVIFTQNATNALKLIGESFPFNKNSRFVLTSDNHNSVNGIREYAAQKGTEVIYVPVNDSFDHDYLTPYLRKSDNVNGNLFAFPAQSNFSGTKYPLSWIEFAHTMGYKVILDAAAFVPTNVLDLEIIKPDFVPVSFYKMFGYPTGVGALIARNEAAATLYRDWFSGGTVDLVTTKHTSHHMLKAPRGFEDGTLNFLDITAVATGLEFLQKVGMTNIHEHVMELTRYLIQNLNKLTHSNGEPMLVIYSPNNPEATGSAIAFNILTPTGKVVDPRIVGKRATENHISIRTGCFCNPGSGEHYFGYSASEEKTCMESFLSGNLRIEDFPECAGASTGGAVRVSLGIATLERDLDKLVSVISSFSNCSERINDQKVETSFSC